MGPISSPIKVGEGQGNGVLGPLVLGASTSAILSSLVSSAPK